MLRGAPSSWEERVDTRRFDTLVRAFAAGGTRRRLVAVVTALPLVGVLTGLSGDEAEAE
jgi:hypothetical protein